MPETLAHRPLRRFVSRRAVGDSFGSCQTSVRLVPIKCLEAECRPARHERPTAAPRRFLGTQHGHSPLSGNDSDAWVPIVEPSPVAPVSTTPHSKRDSAVLHPNCFRGCGYLVRYPSSRSRLELWSPMPRHVRKVSKPKQMRQGRSRRVGLGKASPLVTLWPCEQFRDTLS